VNPDHAPLDRALVKRWETAWPKALEAWGPWTRLPDPFFATLPEDVAAHRLTGVLAQFSMESKGVQVNLLELRRQKLQEFPLEILAHEVGHHVFAPSDLRTHFRILAQIRKGLPTLENRAGEVANLWTDILVNDRLFRNASLPMDKPYRALKSEGGLVWSFYMRVYERLWELEKGALDGNENRFTTLLQTFEADTWLGARTARVYADDPVRGAGRFAALLLPWLLQEKEQRRQMKIWMDGRDAAKGSPIPAGLGLGDDGEPVHPSMDPGISGDTGESDRDAGGKTPPRTSSGPGGTGQWREPWEYGELLKAGGIKADDIAIAVQYYRERALPHLVSTPRVSLPARKDPLPEGLDPWDLGDPMESLDLFQSILQSPILVPGVTTVSRHWGEQEGPETRLAPLDLDLYVDSSGSMPDPRHSTSYLALAGAIVALSTLRRGGSVQVTLWSGTQQCLRTGGFVRDEDEVLSVLCSHFGGSTAFPLHALRSTWDQPKTRRKAHILHISDDGLSTLFDKDERGESGWDINERALRNAGGGGTMVLNLPQYAKGIHGGVFDKARDSQGWDVYEIQDWGDLMKFAVEFSATHSKREKSRP
jgi:hypothetical protein